MTTDFRDPDFIFSLLRISINQLDEAPDSPAVWFALDKDKNVLYIGEAVKDLRFSLGSTQKKLISELKENNVFSIAYWSGDAKKVKDLAKKTRNFFKPRLNCNKRRIFVPAINALVKNTGLSKTDIITKSDLGVNFFNNLENNNRGIYTSTLENILLSDYVNKKIFKEFLLEIIRLWQLYKEYPDDEQQYKIDDDATLEEAVLAVLDDSKEKKNDEIKALGSIREKLDLDGCFTPEDFEDAKVKTLTYITYRQGQPKFRRRLLEAYNGQCAITGFDFEQALEAAHIHPYKGNDTNKVWNGLLLRGDIHTLFDLYLITVHPETKKVHISPELETTKYKELDGKKLNLPELAQEESPLRQKVLKWHYKQCEWITD